MKTDRTTRGFTLIEMLVVLALMALVMALTFPQVLGMLNRIKIEGAARETAVLMRAARLEAIKRNCYGVVMIDPAARQVVAFADVDRDGSYDPGDSPPDVLIGRIELPAKLIFKDGEGHEGLTSVNGFEYDDPLADHQAIFKEDGSALDEGAIRIADYRGNILEARVAPQTTGKVEIRKHTTGTTYVPKGEGANAWTYK